MAEAFVIGKTLSVYTNSEFIFAHIKAFLKDEDERD